ncbi:putative oligopeptide transport ATP-binding protein YkfD [Geobacter sp. OR-1]|uniref:ABC transporter ATP-binding protein n=1 Tax=Geobacter sp. OR-1 TaxID=1266765 RepID=UPI000541E14F|nr:oligopeptide/dipeptide ABC transporter ATP-binding protein [Geobacter sp. OR-1]GAM11134.1 putative oligopeptide transport ATP-binding protein YkfD [Geobacter sp. OR-1]
MTGQGKKKNEPLLRVANLVVEFPAGRGKRVHAVSGVSFTLDRGETLGLVGESGCGKSSLARAIMQLPAPTAGRVLLDGEELTTVDSVWLRILRRRFQMIFQDPVSSLNPSRPVGRSIEAPLLAMGHDGPTERTRRAREMMTAVGLDPDRYYDRRPDQLSGGQCQRVSIARALMTGPELLVCDEPVSALDVSVQAQVVNLLAEIRRTYGLAILFIAHDLAVVKNISDRVGVMCLGHMCEVAPCESLYAAPSHPYTAALLAAVPRPDPGYHPPETGLLPGELPSPLDPPSGCRFRTRCPYNDLLCATTQPELREIAPGHLVACHHPLQGKGGV